MEQLLDLVIRDRKGIVVKASAVSITSYNAKGKFDILPLHSNFISLVENSIAYTDQNGVRKDYKVDKALMKVASNKVRVYLSI